MALVMRGESVAIVDGGREMARLMPPAAPALAVNGAKPAAGEDWRKARLEGTFPEPVISASAPRWRHSAPNVSERMAYADSSLLLKLYLRKPDTPAALVAMGRASGPVFFTELHRLEIVNAIRRNLAAKRIRRSQALKALRTLRHDLRRSHYTLPTVPRRIAPFGASQHKLDIKISVVRRHT